MKRSLGAFVGVVLLVAVVARAQEARTRAVAQAKGASAEPKSPGGDVSCKALDESGKVVARAGRKRSALSCRAALREKVTRDACTAGQVLKLRFISRTEGKESEPESFDVTCR